MHQQLNQKDLIMQYMLGVIPHDKPMELKKAIPEVRLAISECGGRAVKEDAEIMVVLERLVERKMIRIPDGTHALRTVQVMPRQQAQAFLNMIGGFAGT